MEIAHILRALRRYWLTASIAAFIAFASVLGFTLLRGETYASYTRIIAAPSPPAAGDTTSSLDAWRTAQLQVQSFPGLITSYDVLSPVIQELKLPTTPGRLARQIEAEVPVDAVYMNITVKADSPTSAAAIARSLIARFVERYNTLNRQRQTPLRVEAISQPQVASTPVAPDKRMALAAANILAVAAAIIAVLVRVRLARHIQDEHDVAAIVRRTPVLPVTGQDPMGAYHVTAARLRAHPPTTQSHADPRQRLETIAVIPCETEKAHASALQLAAACRDFYDSVRVTDASAPSGLSAGDLAESDRHDHPPIRANALPATKDQSVPDATPPAQRLSIVACSPMRDNLRSDAAIAAASFAVILATESKTRQSSLRATVGALDELNVPVLSVILRDQPQK